MTKVLEFSGIAGRSFPEATISTSGEVQWKSGYYTGARKILDAFVSTEMSIEPFKRLVKLAARAFYDDYTPKVDNQPKIVRSDNRGMAVVILDALTRREWVREEDLAKDLKIHTRQLRRTLRFLEEEKLVTREQRKETAKAAKLHSAAVAATTEVLSGKEGADKVKLHTQSYCCLDYAQIYDVVRYRLHRLKKKLRVELEEKNTIQEYVCPKCGRRYNAYDAPLLISPDDEFFHCENCKGVLVAESDKLTVPEGDSDDNARMRRMETQLKPLTEQLNRVKDIQFPYFVNLRAWEVKARDAGRADKKVDVAFPGFDGKEEDAKSENAGSGQKPMPPWFLDDKKSAVIDDKQSIKNEYVKAYFAELLKQQQEASPQRQVGMKSKREDEDDDYWKEAPIGGSSEGNRLNDLNEEGKATPENEEDDIDWEEG